MRYIVAIIFVLLAAFCGFGLLTSFEPGVSMLWKIGYACGALGFVTAAALMARPARRLQG